jgi:NCAIR mutase (PurE)-related protein
MTLSNDIMLDLSRHGRTGLEEAVFCAGKSVAHIIEILHRVESGDGRVLLTRLTQDKFEALPASQRSRLDFDPVSGTAFFSGSHPATAPRSIAVVAAGTSDSPVAREAARTLTYCGQLPLEITDVGVAGLWRLLARVEEIRSMRVVIAVAGMDAALPTVLAGLISAPVIGVPTSVGYGVSENGHTALKAMLASCASGLTVTNIDNGYGAACAALRIINSAAREEKPAG